MSHPTLRKVPLQEAVFEFRWELQPVSFAVAPELVGDSSYKLLVGRFFERIREEYPHHEALPTASMPDEMVAYNAQHRFRKAKEGWPLVQLGPGMVSVNQTQNYERQDFQNRCQAAISTFMESYPEVDKLKPLHLTLRFINNFEIGDAGYGEFLREKMGVSIGLPEELFAANQIDPTAKYLNLTSEYYSSNPKGVAALRFESVIRKSTKQRLIRMESTVLSQKTDLPQLPDGVADWINSAHNIIENWFFTIIDGQILESLK